MIDQSAVDILALTGACTELKRVGSQYMGPCPFCGGEDRFYVSPRKQAWGCRHCTPGYNDAISFVAKRDGLNLRQDFDRALTALALPVSQYVTRPPANRPKPEVQISDLGDYDAFLTGWQRGADKFITDTVNALHSESGAKALEYLTVKRGLRVSSVERYELGYNATAHERSWGGVKVWLPRGIVIPWHNNHGGYWRIRIRRADGSGKKYAQAGGAANGLYVAGGRIMPHKTVVLAEGEFDALAVVNGLLNELGRMPAVIAVATGGTTQARVMRHAVTLSLAHRVLVAFDTDEAGEKAAAWWLKALPNAMRLVPTRHDINDMLLAGDSIAAWVRGALVA